MPLIKKSYNSKKPITTPVYDAEYYLSSKLVSWPTVTRRFSEGVKIWGSNPEQVRNSFSSYKTYSNSFFVKLKPNFKKIKHVKFEQVTRERKSARAFSSRAIPFSELSNILILSCGLKENSKWLDKPKKMTHWPQRAMPSGGKLYPLEFYILALNVKGIQKGLYHFDLLKGGLSLLRDDSEIFQLELFWAQKNLFGVPSVLVFATSVFERSRVKYGVRALRNILIEVGAVGGQMNMAANAQGLGFCFSAGAFEDKIEELLGVDGIQEGIITSFVLGYEKL